MAITEPVLFPFEADWSEPFIERRSFATTIIPLIDDSEQRAALTIVPVRQFNYMLTEVDAQQASRMGARVWGAHTKIWWAPYWPQAQLLTADLTIGATVIPITTARLGLVNGQGVMLYRTPAYAELAIVSTFTGSNITLQAGLVRSWNGITSRDRLVPVFRAKMELSSEFEFPNPDWSIHHPTFELEPGL